MNHLVAALQEDYRIGAREGLEEIGWCPKEPNMYALYALARNQVGDILEKRPDTLRPLLDTLQAHPDKYPCAFSDEAQRAAFVRSLTEMGWPACESLLDMLRVNHFHMRETAEEALMALADGRAVPGLLALLSTARVKGQYFPLDWPRAVIRLLGKTGDRRAVQPLLDMLSDTHQRLLDSTRDTLRKSVREQVVRELITSLGAIRDQRAIEPLVNLLDSPQYSVPSAASKALENVVDGERDVVRIADSSSRLSPKGRVAAMELLAKIGGEVAADVLLRATKDEDSYVRERSAVSLAQIGDRRAIAPLLVIFATKDMTGGETCRYGFIGPRDYCDVVNALHNVVDETALEQLLHIIRQVLEGASTGQRRDRIMECRAQDAASLLGKIGDERSVPHLVSLLKCGIDVLPKRRVVEALAEIGDGTAVKSLFDYLDQYRPAISRTVSIG